MQCGHSGLPTSGKTLDMEMNRSPESRDEEGIFAVPISLSAGTLVDENKLDVRVREVSVEFQRIGLYSGFAEMQGVACGIEQNRATELVGRIAAVGEQLVLAGAAFRDARSWQLREEATAGVAGRALTEMVSYFAYGAAHGMINATARLFAMERRSREMLKQSSPKRSPNDGFPPFGTKPGHWISFNSKNIDLIQSAVGHHPESSRLLDVLKNLNADGGWNSMIDRRHNDFHRWRPQSSRAGVAPEPQWFDVGEQVQALAVHDGNAYVPEPLKTFIVEAGRGLEALTAALETWISLYPAVSRQVHEFTLADIVSHG